MATLSKTNTTKGQNQDEDPSSQILGEGFKGSQAHSCFVEFQELRSLSTEKGQRRIATVSPTFHHEAIRRLFFCNTPCFGSGVF